MMDTLLQVKKLMEMEKQIRSFISEGDFVRAVQVCVECRGLVNRYDDYLCVRGFAGKIEVLHLSPLLNKLQRYRMMIYRRRNDR